MSINLKKDIHRNELRVIEELMTVLTKDTTDMDPLMLSVLLKRAEVFLGEWRSRLRGTANTAYVALQTSQPDRHTWPIDKLAVLTAYTAAGSWEYPPEITKQMVELHAKQELAKRNKTARKVAAPPPDPTQTPLFAISLKDTPQ